MLAIGLPKAGTDSGVAASPSFVKTTAVAAADACASDSPLGLAEACDVLRDSCAGLICSSGMSLCLTEGGLLRPGLAVPMGMS